MSHFTTIKTRIENLDRLKTVLSELDYTYVEQTGSTKVLIKGWNRAQEEVILSIKTGCSYDIGVIVNQEEGTLGFVADWWGVETGTGISQTEFIDRITQKYAYSTIMEKIKAKGYDIVSEKTDETQSIRIVVRKWE
jgi:hypothetical protein